MVKIPLRDKISPCVESKDTKDYLILLEMREQNLVEKLCGSKYNRNKKEYKRYKTREKIIFTKFGKIKHKFVYVKKEGEESFSPLLRNLGIPKGQHISNDFKRVLADKPSKMTYRKSSEDANNSFDIEISHTTLHKYVKETSIEVTVECEQNPDHKVLIADGTKTRGPGIKHNARAIMSLGQEVNDKNLLKLAINKSWKDMAKEIDLSQYKAFVGDGESGLSEAFCGENIKFHFCREHAIRDLAFYLWREGLPKKEYTQYVESLRSILWCVENSTNKHVEDGNFMRLQWRINWGKKEINTLAAKLSCRGMHEASAFLMRNKEYFLTAAEMAIIGVNVPWTTNIMERAMQEMGIRTKKKGMYWSEAGLNRILKIVMKRYFLPQERRNYKEIFTNNEMEAVEF